VRLRFNDELTQKEIADAVGLTQAQVSRVLTRVLAEMRATLLGRSPAA
jgi:RNA polymerase sigma-B factor